MDPMAIQDISQILPEFDEKLKQMRILLGQMNHFWAMEITDDLVNQVEHNSLPASEKLHLFNIIIKVWQEHLRDLIGDLFNNWPFVYNAYHQLFELLYYIKDHARIVDNGIRLAKNLIQLQFASKDQIAEFLESLAITTFQINDFQGSLELLFLAIYFRGNYLKTEYFDKCFSQLDLIIQRLSPDQRPILFNCFLNNAYQRFFAGNIKPKEGQNEEEITQAEQEEYKNFVEVLYRASVNAVSAAVREGLQSVKKMQIRVRDLAMAYEGVGETIDTLLLINEPSWAFNILVNYCESLRKFNRTEEKTKFIRNFIDKSYRQGGYDTALQAYTFFASVLPKKSNAFQPELVQIYVDAAKKFRNVSDQTFFVKAIEILKEYLVIPKDFKEFQDFCFSINEYYALKRGRIQATPEEFWWAVFHRCVFEEGFEDIARIAAKALNIMDIPFIGRFFMEIIPITIAKVKQRKESSKEIAIGGMYPVKINIKWRIPQGKPMKMLSQLYYSSGLVQERLFEFEEIWDEPILRQLYLNMSQYATNPSNTAGLRNTGIVPLNQFQFGKLAYIMLPAQVRDFTNQLNLKMEQIPEISIIMDTPHFPLEMLHDQNSPLGVKFSFGYRFREPKLTPERFEFESNKNAPKIKHNILIVGDMNKEVPKIWNDKGQKKEPLAAFPAGTEEARYVATKIQGYNELVEELTSFNTSSCTKDAIGKAITLGKYHILCLASNLFYSPSNPLESYFYTADSQMMNLRDILEMLSYARKHNRVQNLPFIRPLLIFDGRILVNSDKIMARSFEAMSNLSHFLSSKHILGMLARVSTEFNEHLQNYLGIFIERILFNESIGSALLTANRQIYLTARKMMLGDNPNVALNQLLMETHYVYFGEPFLKLDKGTKD